jgi:hypothetical protein
MITARAGPATVRSPYVVSGYEPAGRLAGAGVAGPVRFQEEYRLAQDGAATLLTQSASSYKQPLTILTPRKAPGARSATGASMGANVFSRPRT